MKTCVSTYSLGRYFEELGLSGTIRKAAAMGFDGIEFVSGDWMRTANAPLIIQTACEQVGITPVALCVGADFLNTGGEIGRVRALVRYAKEMGVSMLRHDVVYSDGGLQFDQIIEKVAPKIRELTQYAESLGIRTMTENHGFVSQDAHRVKALIEAVDHENFGALIDIGNFLCADEYPPDSVNTLLPYAVHVHAKDFFVKSASEPNPGKGWFLSRGGTYLRGTVIGHGSADAAKSLRLIRDSGYDGFVTVEFEGMEDNLEGIKIGLDNLRRFWQE
ncbi:MAG: sugar phosphate isomerase/epimerase [Clostridia bacterium]|nr:sugar phosphate isomerase/epimerase [Clostridia bacterium]